MALPASVLLVEPSLEEKTIKAGIIARALAVYRVDVVHVFRDPDTTQEDYSLLVSLLRYAVTPPHLRRRLVPLRRSLRYAGIMPPIQTPRHTPPEAPRPGDLIDGLVESAGGGSCVVWLGSAGYAEVRGCGTPRPGSVITVKITGRGESGRLLGVRSDWGDVYVGFKVRRADTVEEVVRRARARGLRVVGTDKHGKCLTDPRELAHPRGILLVFGGPKKGLLEYTSEGLYDVVANFIPGQGSVTVRTEEALQAVLAIINLGVPF